MYICKWRQGKSISRHGNLVAGYMRDSSGCAQTALNLCGRTMVLNVVEDHEGLGDVPEPFSGYWAQSKTGDGAEEAVVGREADG